VQKVLVLDGCASASTIEFLNDIKHSVELLHLPDLEMIDVYITTWLTYYFCGNLVSCINHRVVQSTDFGKKHAVKVFGADGQVEPSMQHCVPAQ